MSSGDDSELFTVQENASTFATAIDQLKERIKYGALLPRCLHCKMVRNNHMPDGKCLFLPTTWSVL